MSEEITLYVSYFIAQPKRAWNRINVNNVNKDNNNDDQIVATQRQVVNDFIQNKPESKIIETFIEIPNNKRSNKWPSLERAINACRIHNATLLIAELGTLTNNEIFTKLLISSEVNFYCCDQPFVNRNILEALFQHAQVQRKLHGKLIREGLKMTSAKSGNPNAAEVISKVNKPKIDTAIVFAFLLQPIIADYKRKGYSQRQMVKTLNEEGFTAPEGGKWVLSQLQKVLDRVRLNEVALALREQFEQFKKDNLSESEIAIELNSRGISSIKNSLWDEAQIKKVITRLDQIHEIELINSFTLNILPILHEYSNRGLSTIDMLNEFEKFGIPIKQSEIAA